MAPGVGATDHRPNLFMLGFPKCATTTLFMWLDGHPGIAGSQDKETRWFYPVLQGDSLPEDQGEYLAQWDGADPGVRYRMDGSPALVYGDERMVAALDEVARPEKAIVLLRDPVARLRGGYRFLRSRLLLSEDTDYATFVAESAARLDPGAPRGRDDGPYDQLSQSCFGHYLEPWVERFGADLYVTFAETLRTDPIGSQDRLHEWLGLPALGGQLRGGDHHPSASPRLTGLHRLALGLHQQLEPFWRRHPHVKVRLRDTYLRLNHGKDVAPVEDDQDAVVTDLLAPHLERLPEALVGATVDPELPSWYAALLHPAQHEPR